MGKKSKKQTNQNKQPQPQLQQTQEPQQTQIAQFQSQIQQIPKSILKNSNELPFVSVCTPTFNRRPFIPNMFQCFLNQDYPKHRIEWIIVDDGTDKIEDLIEKSNITQIRYFKVDKKMTLGAKRNYMHKFVRGSIVVYMDDDDYYPPERISHAVDRLTKNPQALCAGASEIYIYFKHIEKMIQCGPYGPTHATAGTFAFKSELLKITSYEEHAAVAEERAFLKDYSIPFVQLDSMKTILVFSHEHNTFDKRKMLENPHPDYFKESPKTVYDFIRKDYEAPIYDFFMLKIDKLLEKYEPGEPKMKPDVLKQIKEIEAKRADMIKEEMERQKANGPIMLNRPGEQPIALSNQQVVDLISQQQRQLQELLNRSGELESMVTNLQKQLIEKTKTTQTLTIELNQTRKKLNEFEVSMQKQIEIMSREPESVHELVPDVVPDLVPEPESQETNYQKIIRVIEKVNQPVTNTFTRINIENLDDSDDEIEAPVSKFNDFSKPKIEPEILIKI
jgi:glycosyltransferase involved in cell wall biosynthesis